MSFLSGACRFLGTVTLSSLLVLAPEAEAAFHLAEISEVMTSYNGDAGVQFVEILMNASGQQFVSGSKLAAFGANGDFLGVAFEVPSDVGGGAGRRWMMATAGFATLSGLAPDFVFAPVLPTGAGMICWGMPPAGTEAVPACDDPFGGYVDCVAYGGYSGPTGGCGDPVAASPDGHSLRRSPEIFECADPADPENNAGETVMLDATAPCISVTTTMIPTTTIFATTTTLLEALCGDANGDQAVTASDALFALRAAIGLTQCPLVICDVNDNGSLSAADALQVLAHAVGQAVELTCPLE